MGYYWSKNHSGNGNFSNFYSCFCLCCQCLNANPEGDGVEQATLWKNEEVWKESPTLHLTYCYLGTGDSLLRTRCAPAWVFQRVLHCGGTLCWCSQKMLWVWPKIYFFCLSYKLFGSQPTTVCSDLHRAF